MCTSGATCPPADNCCSELALIKRVLFFRIFTDHFILCQTTFTEAYNNCTELYFIPWNMHSINSRKHGAVSLFHDKNKITNNIVGKKCELLVISLLLKPGIHDTSFASKSPFKKTWIKKTWIQVCVYTMQEILMNTHKFWWEIQQTKWHFWEERRVLPFVLHYYVQLYCEGD